MKFNILGPLQVISDDGTVVELTRSSLRVTTTALLLLSRAPVIRSQLVEALWGAHPPLVSAERAVDQRLSLVRLGIGADRVRQWRTAGDRYYQVQLRVLPGELDCDTFRDLASMGQAAADRGDPQGAARFLQQAEDLWREPPWSDLPQTQMMLAAAGRLDEQRADAREALIDARLALGQHRELVTVLREEAEASPLREHLSAQLMLALYRCGRTADALEAYARVRTVLARECGTDPGPELKELQRQILKGDERLAFGPWQRPAAAAALPVWTPLHQLPPSPADFTGRTAQLEDLARRLPGSTGTVIFQITGPPGAGKTTLAVQAGHLVRNSFPDGQLYVSLGNREAGDILAGTLRALGVPADRIPPPGPEREALYRSTLAHRKLLVIADDAVTSAQVRPLLPGTPGSAVLVTTRHWLADLEAAHLIEVGELSPQEAVTLIATSAGIDQDAGTATAPALTAIAGACGRLPLALRAAGARLAGEPGLTPGNLARALGQPGTLSELTIGGFSVRQRLSTAYDILNGPAQAAFRLLSVHPTGDIPGWVIPAIAGGGDATAGEIARTGLLTVTAPGTGKPVRYGIHVLTRHYAAERRDADTPPEAAAAARATMVRAWTELAWQAGRDLPPHPCLPPPGPPAGRDVFPPGQREAITAAGRSWFDAERRNLSAVAGDACARGDHHGAAALADCGFAAQCQLGAHDEAGTLWESVAAAARKAGDRLAVARARYRLAALEHGDDGLVASRRAAHHLQGCLWEFVQAGDYRATADTLYLMATCAIANNDPAPAARYATQGLDAAHRADDQRPAFLNLSAMGLALVWLGSADEGLDRCRTAEQIAANLGETVYEELAHRVMLRARLLAGDPPLSRALRPAR